MATMTGRISDLAPLDRDNVDDPAPGLPTTTDQSRDCKYLSAACPLDASNSPSLPNESADADDHTTSFKLGYSDWLRFNRDQCAQMDGGSPAPTSTASTGVAFQIQPAPTSTTSTDVAFQMLSNGNKDMAYGSNWLQSFAAVGALLA